MHVVHSTLIAEASFLIFIGGVGGIGWHDLGLDHVHVGELGLNFGGGGLEIEFGGVDVSIGVAVDDE